MKTIFRLTCFALIATFTFSCGNKKDSTEGTATPGQEPAEAITLSLTMAPDPCYGNDNDILHINGGKPFEDETNPFKVEAKNLEQGSIEFGTFSKNEDGSYQIDIAGTISLFEGELPIEVFVTDAAGTTQTITFTIPHCL